MLVLKRTFFGLACVLAISLLFTPRAHAAGTDNAARAAIVVHPETGAVLYEKNADERLGIASTTKIMTALVVLEHCALDEPVEILPEYTAVEGSSMYLRAGETYTVEELLYGLMLVSGNDAAIALACHTAGSVAAFAGMMNDKARALGMTSSAFQNPNGLDAEGHYSTARDMAKLACAALENETFRAIVSTKSTTVDGQTLVNHNRLLRSYDGAVGVKTGYTKTAGRTLVSCAQRGTTQFVCVTLSDPDDWNDHMNLYDYGFAQLAERTYTAGFQLISLPVVGGEKECISLTLQTQESAVLPKDVTVTAGCMLPQFVYAPVEKGDVIGCVRYSVNGKVLKETPLVSSEDCALQKDERTWLQKWFARFLRSTSFIN